MTVQNVELLHGLKLGSNFFSQLENADPTFNDEQFPVTASGDTHPRFISLNGSKEEVPFATHQIGTLLAQLGLFGAGGTGAYVLFRKVANKSTRVGAATAEHTKFTMASWFSYLMSLSAGHRQQAVARGRVIALYDGTNSPFVRSSVAISSDTPSTAESFVLGPIAHNGTKIGGCDNFSMDLAPNMIELADESDQGTTFCAINTISPVITFTTTALAAELLRGTGVTTSFKINLLRRKPDGYLYGPLETQHIVINVARGMFFVNGLSGNPTQKQVSLLCRGTDAGGYTDVPLTMTVNSAVDTAA
ncbi:MAG: hypothetical protein JNL58_04475 [Planctomyces sp.]|nr:hypothetical protein [Planctomyces sp.]